MSAARYEPLVRCSRIAARQHGAISARQATAAGLSTRAIQRIVSRGLWIRARPGVYVLWVPRQRDQIWRQRLFTGALWLGDESAVSHRAAAFVRGFDGVVRSPLEFSTAGRRRSAIGDLIIHRVTSLAPNDVAIVDNVRVTSAARTLVDLSGVVAPAVTELALESALRRRSVDLDDVRQALARAGRTHAGRAVLRSIVDGHPGTATESALETLVWRLIMRARLPAPLRQYTVTDGYGRFVARVDFAWPDAGIVVEADGYEYHSSSRDWRRERQRQNALVKLGWTVYRITWQDATRRGDRIAGDLARLLAGRPTASWSRSRKAKV